MEPLPVMKRTIGLLGPAGHPRGADPRYRAAEGDHDLEPYPGGDAQREQAAAITAKVDGYDFRLPTDRTELLGSTTTELTNEQKG
jgi:hypothetical protein